MKIKSILKWPLIHRYRTYSILLPADHLLPIYQLRHQKYDRFLPCLVERLHSSDTVIDVGANVGDTLAAMAEHNPNLDYICIEPDEAFFGYLQKNILRIRGAIADLKVQAIKSLVGKNVSGVLLEGASGTKHAVSSEHGGIQSMTLDRLLADIPCSSLRLLKSDVDGFDYDVIDSSSSLIRAHGPMIYFECHCESDHQKAAYIKTVSWLESEGYCDWTIFDNFGEVIARTKILSVLVQLMHDLWNQKGLAAMRTIYYVDILAVQQRDAALVDHVLAEYSES